MVQPGRLALRAAKWSARGAKHLREQMYLGAKHIGEQTSQGAKCGGVKHLVLNMKGIKQVIASTKL